MAGPAKDVAHAEHNLLIVDEYPRKAIHVNFKIPALSNGPGHVKMVFALFSRFIGGQIMHSQGVFPSWIG